MKFKELEKLLKAMLDDDSEENFKRYERGLVEFVDHHGPQKAEQILFDKGLEPQVVCVAIILHETWKEQGMHIYSWQYKINVPGTGRSFDNAYDYADYVISLDEEEMEKIKSVNPNDGN